MATLRFVAENTEMSRNVSDFRDRITFTRFLGKFILIIIRTNSHHNQTRPCFIAHQLIEWIIDSKKNCRFYIGFMDLVVVLMGGIWLSLIILKIEIHVGNTPFFCILISSEYSKISFNTGTSSRNCKIFISSITLLAFSLCKVLEISKWIKSDSFPHSLQFIQ